MFIKLHLPRLDEIIDLRRPKMADTEIDGKKPNAMATGGMGMARAARRGPVEYVGIVDWNPANRKTVRAQFKMERVPSTLRIRVAQEDLWIYEALLRVVAHTNAGATGNFNAAVKRIDFLGVGASAGGLSQGGSQFSRGGGMGGGVDGMMGDMGMAEMEMAGGAMGGEGMDAMGMGGMGMGGMGAGGNAGKSANTERSKLLAGRFVDLAGKPLDADASHPYAEFKMMPVRLSVVVEQDKISNLLVNCANSTMPIDVRRVSLGKQSGSSASFNTGRGMGGTGMGGMGMGGMGMEDAGMGAMGMGMGDPGMGGMGMGDPGMGGMGMGGDNSFGALGGGDGGDSKRTQIVLVSQKEIPVEIEGIIYIFNKPTREEMGTGTAEGSGAEGTESAPEPDSTPAAAAPPETAPTAPASAVPTPAAPAGTQEPPDAPSPTPTAPVSPAADTTPPAAGTPVDSQPAATQPVPGQEPVNP